MTDSSGHHRVTWTDDSCEEPLPSGSSEPVRPARPFIESLAQGKAGQRRNHPIPLITYAQISSLSEQVSFPVVDIIRALVRNGGDGEAAREMLELNQVGCDGVVERVIG